MVVVNHVLAAGCQLVDGLSVVGQGLLQPLMLLHLRLGAELVLGMTAGIREEGLRGESSSPAA